MIHDEISIQQLVTEIKNRWLYILLLIVLIFASLFGSNYYLYKAAENNTYYTKEVDVNIAIAKKAELRSVAKEVIDGETFKEQALSVTGVAIDDELLDNIIYGQTYFEKEGAALFIVRILISDKDKQNIDDFLSAFATVGEPLLEEQFESEVSIEQKEYEKIVAGKNANLNLAAPYDSYMVMHAPNVRNIMIWLLFAVIIGFCIMVLWILFRDSFRRKNNNCEANEI